jgi:acetyl esterase/lipase
MATNLVVSSCSKTGHDGSTAFTRGDPGESVTPSLDCPRSAPPASTDVNMQEDVTYATAGDYAQRLDIAWPKTGGPHPLIVLIHGGAWSGGSKLDMRNEMLAFARAGYVAASVGYRLTQAPENVFPAALQDVRCAVRWLRSRASVYGIDGSRVAAAGYSAGGHLSSLLGVAADVAELDGRCPAGELPASVSAVISYAGPQDLRVNGPYTEEQARLVTNFLGAFPGDEPALAALASPAAHVSAGDPPFLFVHGTEDDLVPVEQARRMKAALRQAGTRATLLELRGTGHAFVGLASSDIPEVRCTTLAFLERWL